MSFITRPKLKRWLIRLVLDAQPSQVFMHWHTALPGIDTGGQCRGYVDTTDPRFTNKDRATREGLLCVARRAGGMPRERLISRLFRWYMERQGKAVVYPVDMPTFVKHWSSSTKAAVQARKAREAYEALSQFEKDQRPAAGYRTNHPPCSVDLPAFLRKQQW